MENYLYYINIIVLLFVLIYGLGFGIRNTILRVISFLPNTTFKQREIGKLFDATFIIGIMYFCTFGKSFILGLGL